MRSLFRKALRRLRRHDADVTLRETIEELIEESDGEEFSIESDERQLIGNVLDLRDLTASDVMIPRADIIAVPDTIEGEELIELFIKTGVSRLPVYKDSLDQVLGVIDIKEALAWLNSKKPFKMKSVIRDVLFISPAMRTLDLLLQMRESGRKLAIVVDEFGGVDGIVTFANLIEEIIGDIQDAHTQSPKSQITLKADGTITADARTTLEELDETTGHTLDLNGEGEDIETLGGLVVFLAGRVPVRGELIQHPKGLSFEVLDADPRRVKRLCLRNWEKALVTED
jgi:CBS domain containing-hemolysin-like protein